MTIASRTRGCITDTSGMLTTLQQLGGTGIVRNKSLVVPLHFGETVHSIEYVQVACGASVGPHTQQTDEIYYILTGVGNLTTNGEESQVEAGDLVIAPRGTQHAIANPDGNISLTFLVIEVTTHASLMRPPTVVKAFFQGGGPRETALMALVGQRRVSVQACQVDLADYFTGPWGLLSLLDLPPGCCVEEYILPDVDENLFIFPGCQALLEVDGQPFQTDELLCHGLNAFIPAGVPRRLVNQLEVASLRVLSVQFQRVDTRHHLRAAS